MIHSKIILKQNYRTKIILLSLPELKLQYDPISAKYLGAKIFNDLPIELASIAKKRILIVFLKNRFLS